MSTDADTDTNNVVTLARSWRADAPARPPEDALDARMRWRLEHLRALAINSQLESRAALERMCLLVQATPIASLKQTALALFGTLATHASQRLTFHRPGTGRVSPSEIWLLRLLAEYQSFDTPSGRALVTWRVKQPRQRRIRFLAGRLADALAEIEAPMFPINQAPTELKTQERNIA